MKTLLLKLASLSIALVSLAGCQQELDVDVATTRISPNETIYQKRRVPIPTLPKRQRPRSLSADAPDLNLAPYNVLGAVHGIGNGFIGHPMNIGNDGVINVKSLLADKRTSKFLFNRNVDVTVSQVQTYHDEEALAKVVDKTKKITTGFSLNLGLFSIGQKSTFENRFHSELRTNGLHTWANVDLMYYANRIGIESTDAALTAIACRNLDDTFLYLIYNAPLSDFILKKGFLVVTDFYTGGRLSALVDYQKKEHYTKETTNHDIDFDIAASFGWGKSDTTKNLTPKSGNKASIYAGLSTRDGKSLITYDAMEKLAGSFSVYGGKKSSNIPSALMNLKDSRIDLGDWYESLSDPKLHKYVDVYDGGLVSIDKFMLESNFKHRLLGILSGKLQKKDHLDVPC